jgi:predicted short-subunit dehydrogenase-like oxidoreductase (DUF2520 family)
VERVGFIGAGRAGTALARGLRAAGWPVVAVSSRTPSHARRLARAVRGAEAVEWPQTVADAADLVCLTVPDTAITAVAENVVWREGQAVVHTSGVESLDVLAAAARAGAQVGSMHPLQTFAAPAADPLAPFRGITCVLEGDARLLPRLEAVTEALGARALVLPEGAKARYHAAAVFAANYVVTALHTAAELWATFGVPAPTALAALLPLTRAAIENVAVHGAAGALTGPVARGDVATVEKHLAALAEARPEVLRAYRALGEGTLRLARRRGRLDPAAAAALAALFAEP